MSESGSQVEDVEADDYMEARVALRIAREHVEDAVNDCGDFAQASRWSRALDAIEQAEEHLAGSGAVV